MGNKGRGSTFYIEDGEEWESNRTFNNNSIKDCVVCVIRFTMIFKIVKNRSSLMFSLLNPLILGTLWITFIKIAMVRNHETPAFQNCCIFI